MTGFAGHSNSEELLNAAARHVAMIYHLRASRPPLWRWREWRRHSRMIRDQLFTVGRLVEEALQLRLKGR